MGQLFFFLYLSFHATSLASWGSFPLECTIPLREVFRAPPRYQKSLGLRRNEIHTLHQFQ